MFTTIKFAYLNISVYSPICTEHPSYQKVHIPLGSLKHFKASLFESSYTSTYPATAHPRAAASDASFIQHGKRLVNPGLAHPALDMDYLGWTGHTSQERWHQDVAAGDDVESELCFRRVLRSKVGDGGSREKTFSTLSETVQL